MSKKPFPFKVCEQCCAEPGSGSGGEGGTIDEEMIKSIVEKELTTAKKSGEFDGEDGYTPQKGVDYWTPADIAEIKYYVDEAILGGEW
jgi:hypothetical protein